MDLTRISRYMCMLLRHQPAAGGITLDEHGWTDVSALIEAVRKHKAAEFDINTLRRIVAEDNKQRYSFSEDMTRIRCNQGHSVSVDVELEQVEPPEYLWHGTGEKYCESIDTNGLKPKSRLYVHLSGDYDTAVTVGKRHGRPVIYRVCSGQMARDGFTFYRSVNDVWLTKFVPVVYLEKQTVNS